MIKFLRRLSALFITLGLLINPAAAEFLAPDWSKLSIEGISEPDWITGIRDGAFIGMCGACEESVMLQVQDLADDGTGGRVRSGETTTETYTALGEANAAKLGGDSAYYGTEPLTFASAVGFTTRARIATGDYSATYQLWSDGHQLLVKVYGANQATVYSVAERAFRAAAPATFR